MNNVSKFLFIAALVAITFNTVGCEPAQASGANVVVDGAAECENNVDCTGDEVCTDATCVDPDTIECRLNSDCNDDDKVCTDAKCVDKDPPSNVGCTNNDGCEFDEVCTNGTCEELDCEVDECAADHECVDLPPVSDCTLNSACGDAQQCTNGQCVNTSCPSGQHAVNHNECVNDTPSGQCTLNSQCSNGQVCTNGQCVGGNPVNPGPTRTERLCQNAPSGKTVNGDLTGRSFATDGVTLLQSSFANVAVNAARTQICGDITVQTGGFLEHNVTFIPTGFTGYVAFNQNSQSCQITAGASSALGARSLSPVAIPWHCSGLGSCSNAVPASNEGCDARSSVPAP